ncbi:RidA family protein [Seohaeicola saemankumensis]|nr:RidA family protein [Seohaeicola saemankumensis]MCA0870380.1 RidA family protein [Seohaeicola saemankumensis]
MPQIFTLGRTVASALIGILSCTAAAAEPAHQLQSINPPGVQIPGVSQAVVVGSGRLMYLSGHVPFDEKGQMSDDLETQLNQVFSNMQATLEAAGTNFSSLARVTVYIKDYDPGQLPLLRQVRDKWISTATPPASALIGVDALFIPQALVEIDAVAVLPD